MRGRAVSSGVSGISDFSKTDYIRIRTGVGFVLYLFRELFPHFPVLYFRQFSAADFIQFFHGSRQGKDGKFSGTDKTDYLFAAASDTLPPLYGN